MFDGRKLVCRWIGKVFVSSLLMGATLAGSQQSAVYKQTNIISDGAVPALVTDPNFVDPWGISIGQELWINTNVTGFSYVTDDAGNIAFKATIPPASGTGKGSPTGTVAVNGAPAGSFLLSNGQPAVFLFCSLDGTISGWNLNSTGNVAETKVNNSANKAVYTDMALLTNSSGTFILAANFGAGHSVEMYDGSFHSVGSQSGFFVDPNLPAGYAPYAIHTIGSTVYVTYMLRDRTTFQETLGAGTGIVDAFDVNGQLVKRAITGGNLNAPWGMAMAPAGFGKFGGDLLVGNFGDGVINVYDPTSYTLLGQLADANGNVIANSGLWELVFGQGSAATGDANTLYFSAGLNQEKDGLFGSIAAVGPAPAGSFAVNPSATTITVTRGQSGNVTLSLVPSNGFTGTVQLACSGLPAGTACQFSSPSVTISGSGTAQTTLTVSSSTTYTPPPGYGLRAPGGWMKGGSGIALAAITPAAGLLVLGTLRRRKFLTMLGVVALGLVVSLGATGCGGKNSSSSGGTTVATPTGTSQFTVTATSGATTTSTVLTLTVQ
ncbi:TIGR03118 family protein [Acidobacteria bacterium AB60]|nr:TIGR03118 family protein [Acidobacteria bacterium AB60]